MPEIDDVVDPSAFCLNGLGQPGHRNPQSIRVSKIVLEHRVPVRQWGTLGPPARRPRFMGDERTAREYMHIKIYLPN
ncbi:hypothetical protein ACVWW5_002744 [Bradyrhizobium sp. LM3.4]